MTKTKKVVITHIHPRIAKLAQGAIDRGEIISCDRISNKSYLIKRSIDGKRPQTTKFSVVGAATFLFQLNTAANGALSFDPTEPESDFSSPPIPEPIPEVREVGSQPEPESEYLEPEPESDFYGWDSEPESESETKLLETI
ncbi:hypothetical protein QUB00_20390 [Microcoleus sp. F8_C2]